MATKKNDSNSSRAADGPGRDRATKHKLVKRNEFPVIGIGASAGGLEAFSALFNKIPPDTGMAFILIQHIEPSHVANMVGLIQRQTRME